jgi:hypothetical protein
VSLIFYFQHVINYNSHLHNFNLALLQLVEQILHGYIYTYTASQKERHTPLSEKSFLIFCERDKEGKYMYASSKHFGEYSPFLVYYFFFFIFVFASSYFQRLFYDDCIHSNLTVPSNILFVPTSENGCSTKKVQIE